jgi:hypothetical protein
MTILSPCIKVCAIDPASGLCAGCGRSLDEIARWSSFSDAERAHIMAHLAGRIDQRSEGRSRVAESRFDPVAPGE